MAKKKKKTWAFCRPLAIAWCNHDHRYYRIMMIDWLKEVRRHTKKNRETIWHLDIFMHTSMMNFKKEEEEERKRTQLCMDDDKNWRRNSSRTILVNYGSIHVLTLSLSHPSFSLLFSRFLYWALLISIEREKKNDTSLVLSLSLLTRANAQWTIQMWISRTYNCQNKNTKKEKSIRDLFIISLSRPN